MGYNEESTHAGRCQEGR